MSRNLSKWWLLGPPFAIMVSLAAYYAVFPSFRGWVDSGFPWVAAHVGNYLPAREGEVRAGQKNDAVVMRESEQPPMPTPPPVLATPPPKPVYVTADGTVDLVKLSANQADWPKVVVLQNAKEFPAVVGGKTLGSIVVPRGTEVNLLKIEAGKLGLEYRGGGVWAGADETDLADRLRSAAP